MIFLFEVVIRRTPKPIYNRSLSPCFNPPKIDDSSQACKEPKETGQFLILSFYLPPIAVVLLFNIALVWLRIIKHSVYSLRVIHALKALYEVGKSQRMPFRKCKDPFRLL